MFHTVQLRATRSRASGPLTIRSEGSRQKPPWIRTATPRSPPSYRSPNCDASGPYLRRGSKTADGFGKARDAFLDLLRGHAGVRESQRVRAALEQEVGATAEDHLAVGG